MIRSLGVLLICSILSGCSIFNLNNNKNDDRIARCNVIKNRIIFNSATNDQLEQTERRAQLGSLERDYRNLGCT